MRNWLIVVTVLLASLVSSAQASSIAVHVGATIVEVQCTAEQRARIRACAQAEQSLAAVPFKSMAAVAQTDAIGNVAQTYQVRVDPTRQVLLKTVLY